MIDETETTPAPQLSDEELALLDAWWRAANYVSVGQIYLLDNPLLQRPLEREDIKPRLLGHWGTTPGLNLLWTHLNRLIRERDVNAIFLAGPGHGGPAAVANAWLEGTYSEVYPRRRPGRRRDAAAVPAVLLPRRDPQPRRAGDARAPSTRAASSATCSPTRTARRWTTPTWSSPRSSATASSRPDRSPRRGTRTSSSTRSTTARCCRSCTSTATRSPTRRCRPGSRGRSS